MPPLPGADERILRELTAELAADRKIMAIKLAREASGAGLKEAKEWVECPHRPLTAAPVVGVPPFVAPPIAAAPAGARPAFQGKAWGRYELRQLPEEVQKKIVDLSRGWEEPGYAAVATESVAAKIFLLVIGLGLAGTGFGFINFFHRLPTHDVLAFWSPVTALGVYLALGGIAGALRIARGRAKPAVIVNPAVLVRTTGAGPVEIYRLAAVTGVRPIGGWRHELRFGAATLIVDGVPPRGQALVDAATTYFKTGKTPSDAVAKEHDWLRRVEDEREASRPFGGRLVRAVLAVPLAAALVIASWAAAYVREEHRIWDEVRPDGHSMDARWYVGFAKGVESGEVPSFLVGLAPLHEHRARAEEIYDEAVFREAKQAGTSKALRDYVKELPEGRHVADARAALAALYADAEARYVIRAKGANDEAKAGMKALLAALRDQREDQPTVGIVFEPAQGLEGDRVEKHVRDETGSSKVEPVGPAFTKERNEIREGRIVAKMKDAFRSIFPEDLFALEAKDRPGARFVVRHTVRGSGDYYTSKSEKDLPLAQRTVYCGIVVDFEVRLEVGERSFPISFAASPAPNFSVGKSESVYDVMAESAFYELQHQLIKAYGLSE